MEFNTRVLWTDTHECSSTRKTPQLSEEIYEPRLTISIIDYLLKDKINTKFAFQPNIWQIYDQIDRTFFFEILWRFEERLIPNCAFQPFDKYTTNTVQYLIENENVILLNKHLLHS